MSSIVLNRKYVDGFLQAELLKGFQPSALSLSILDAMCDALDTDDAFLVGGCLRDEFNEEDPRDYDIHVDFRSVLKAWKQKNPEADFKDREDIILDLLDDSEHFQLNGSVKTTRVTALETGQRKYIKSFPLSFNNHAVDLTLIPEDISLEERAMYGDAVVNSIAADRNGNVMSHPHFEEDMEDGTYAIRVKGEYDQARSMQRFTDKQMTGHYLGEFSVETSDEYLASLQNT